MEKKLPALAFLRIVFGNFLDQLPYLKQSKNYNTIMTAFQ